MSLEKLTVSRLAYCDDLVFVTNSRTELEAAIDKVNEWCDKTGMSVNKDKSGIMAIRTDKRTTNPKMKNIKSI